VNCSNILNHNSWLLHAAEKGKQAAEADMQMQLQEAWQSLLHIAVAALHCLVLLGTRGLCLLSKS